MYDFTQDDYSFDMFTTLLALQDERYENAEILSFDEELGEELL